MATLAAIRTQHPEYADLSDQQLADGLYKKFYSDMPRDQFDAKVGLKVAPPPPAAANPLPTQPGAGPLDFLTQGMSGLNEGIAQGLGAPVDLVTAAINLGITGANKAFPPDRNLSSLVTGEEPKPRFGYIEHPFGGGDTFKGILSPTIRPETDDPGLKATRRIAQEVGAMTIPGAKPIAMAERPLKVAAQELTAALGSGGGAAIAQAVAPGNPIAELTGQVLGGLTPMGIERAATRPKAPPIPTIDEQRATKDAAYKAADAAGITYSPKQYDDMLTEAITDATMDHISPTRHAAAASFLQDMVNRRSNDPMTLTQLDQLRQEARRDLITPAIGNPEKAADAHFGQIIVDRIDQMIGKDQRGGAVITAARDANVRLRKAETLQDALTRAKLNAASSGSGGNLNNAIRQQIKSILQNPKKSAGFTDEELKAMEDLVKQGNVENLLRWIGKFAPGGNGLIGMLQVGGTIMNPAVAALPVAGMVAKGIADSGTLKKAENIQRMVAKAPRPLPKPRPDDRRVLGALTAAQATSQLPKQPLQITVRGGASR